MVGTWHPFVINGHTLWLISFLRQYFQVEIVVHAGGTQTDSTKADVCDAHKMLCTQCIVVWQFFENRKGLGEVNLGALLIPAR